MKYLTSLLILLMPMMLHAQKEYVVSKWPNGNNKVVVLVKEKGGKQEKVGEVSYFENGKMEYSGEYKDGVEHGTWKYYFEDGTLRAEENWKEGVEEGEWREYHPDGQLKSAFLYRDGKKINQLPK